MREAVQIMPIKAARDLLLRGQGLLADPGRAAPAPAVLDEIRGLGFVQLDSICTVERAHHHILWTRLHDYRPASLDRLQREGRIFEHWTHDASVIPCEWFPHWRHRFGRVAWGSWLRRRIGRGHRAVLDGVLERIRREGPLQARDFEHNGRKSGTWWNWKPAKAALEYLWRTGELAIPRRVGFERVYDLTERVLPEVHPLPAPEIDVHVDWACRTALDRLGAGTARELAGFWDLVTPAQAAAWASAAARRGEIIPVQLDGLALTRPVYARPDWKEHAAGAWEPPAGIRILNPFDPLIRDRARCQRLFGFDYRFEAFVPEAKRSHGYYVLPILEGDRLVGRLDPKLDRGAGVLHIRRVWWEAGVKPTKVRRAALGEALHRYAAFAGASRVEIATSRARS